MSELAVQEVGTGTPVVLVHGSLSVGADEWEAQRPLADEGFRLVVLDRRGYGGSPPARGEDFLRDGEDLADLLDDPAHLVAHSYGGLGAMLAAARRPQQTLSLTLLEAPAFTLGQRSAAVHELLQSMRDLWDSDLADEDWLPRFLAAVGTDPDTLPPDVVPGLLPLVPLLRNGRVPWETGPPLPELAAAPFPKLVVSGAHSPAFDAVCDDLAEQIGASRQVVPGAGHEIQFTGSALNGVLLDFWTAAAAEGTSAGGAGRSQG